MSEFKQKTSVERLRDMYLDCEPKDHPEIDFESHEKAYEEVMTMVEEIQDNSINNGGSTDYYKVPFWATTLQDLIEFKKMSFSQGNILNAIYRCNDETHSEYERELNKIIWFANRELKRIQRGE